MKKLTLKNIIITIVVSVTTTVISFFAINNNSNLDSQIKKNLLDSPEIVIEAIEKYQKSEFAKKNDMYKTAILENENEIYNDIYTPIIGNPNGKRQIVEFFDYSCGYCKKIFPTIVKLVEEDKELKVIMKELPILGDLSILKAKASLSLYMLENNIQDDNTELSKGMVSEKYFEFHKKLMISKITKKSDLEKIAQELGINFNKLSEKMESSKISEIIARNHNLAVKLGIRGTPAIIVNKNLIPGALSYKDLKNLISQQ